MSDLIELKQTGLVTKANSLVEASYRLTSMEQKVILALASKINVNDGELKTYTLSIKEFCNLLGIKGNNQYTRLRQITLGLMRKAFQIRIAEKEVVQVSWLSYVKYREQEGMLEMQFAPFLKEYLIELKKSFTSYTLSNVVRLKHAYSIRLYELLKQYEKIGERTFHIEDLLDKLGLAGTSYKTYGNLKSRVLNPAKEELNRETDIQIEFIEIKQGRKVVGVRFLIHKNIESMSEENKIRVISKKNSEVQVIKDILTSNQLEAPNEIIESWLKKGLEHVKKVLNYAISEPSIQKPPNFTSYILKNNISPESLTTTVKKAKAETRKEMVPNWLRKEKDKEQAQEAHSVEKEQADEISEEESKQKLEAECKRLQELLQKYYKPS
ncbi:MULTISPECIES: replication initiation protein [Bacillus]|uniref:replication initiation protein n=1 Tax=Bacillus TaxID=1386 RepID=UPI0002D221A2|nr:MULTISPECIES: replication initiation protein [Bacillus]MEB9339859.1 replication initiation protein [Bacillus cereus]CCW06791.1 Plasmid replication initiation protein [Bacillus sp. GeD10]